ncbi:MAG: hypothetical protein ABIJ80_02090 [Patescibacteria group bacterium]
MNTQTATKQSMINIPLHALECISGYPKEKKILCEININELKKVNEPQTIDEMATEAKLEYFSGKLKGFKDTKKLINYLNS